MRLFLYTFITFSLTTISSCDEPKTSFDFDSEKWKSDKLGCENIRLKMKDEFLKIKPEIIKRSEQEVIGLLGKPDIQQLDNRSKKSYIYFIEPGNGCENGIKNPSKLVIEFNSINQVRFATFQKW